MALFSDLPLEVIHEIIIHVFLHQQTVNHDTNNDNGVLSVDKSAQALTEYSRSKITTRSFIDKIEGIHECRCYTANVYPGLFDRFCDHRCQRTALLALSLSCRMIYNIVRPLLWGMVELDQRAMIGKENVKKLLDTLVAKPELGTLVKHLAFRHTRKWKNAGIFSGRVISPEVAKGMIRERSIVFTGVDLCNLLSHLPRLTSLKIVLEVIPEFMDVFNQLSSTLIEAPCLQTLTELSFYWQGRYGEPFNAPVLLPFFLLPSIRTLYLGRIRARTKQSPPYLPPTQHFGKSTVKHLILGFSLVQSSFLQALLRLPAALESFTYNIEGTSSYNMNASAADYFEHLLPQKATLKKLETRGTRDIRAAQHPVDAPRAELMREFSVLEELSFPLLLLLFQGGVIRYQLKDLLPRSVVKLRLYIYDDIPPVIWVKELREVFEQKELCCPDLQDVWVEYWKNFDDPYNDKTKMERLMKDIEDLKKMGREARMNVEVVVDLESFTVLYGRVAAF
jgi:hypothetical protein